MNEGHWEQRWHPLREEWVIVSAHRQDRPWIGNTIETTEDKLRDYVSDCYLCPGNKRSSGVSNPRYTSTFVFDNDHPCVGMDAPQDLLPPKGIYRSRPATGIARVVCFDPRHNLTLAEMPSEAAEAVLTTWQKQFTDLGNQQGIQNVLIFENKGKTVGVSNPHPHGQIYATNFVFKTIENEVKVCEKYRQESGQILFQDILKAERADGRRIIFENETAIAFLPYFARYAYEVFVSPKQSHPNIASLSDTETVDLTKVLQHVLVKLDNLWEKSFPYVMPLHQAPTDGEDYPGFHFHFEFHPPLRKPKLLKFLAGPEIGGGNFLSDTVPEEKAAELRAVSDIHYRKQRTV